MTCRLALAALPAAALAGCVATPTAPTAGVRPPTVEAPRYSLVGLERVMGHRAADLTRLFGDARLDVREASARKLQFGGGACILDAYLYPPRGGGEPVVTHVDARRSDGQNVDRAACVSALAHARGQ